MRCVRSPLGGGRTTQPSNRSAPAWAGGDNHDQTILEAFLNVVEFWPIFKQGSSLRRMKERGHAKSYTTRSRWKRLSPPIVFIASNITLPKSFALVM